MKCNEKVPYVKRELADDALRALIKANPRDPRNARLVVYPCSCGVYHVGHVRKRAMAAINKPAPKPAVKPPSPGQLRRAARKAEERAKHDALYADYTENLRICKILVDREFARMEAIKRAAGGGQ